MKKIPFLIKGLILIALGVGCFMISDFRLQQNGLSSPRFLSDSQFQISNLLPHAYAQDVAKPIDAGGEGFNIPTGNVKISEAITQRPFGEALVSMVNYFIGFLGLLAVVAFIYAGVLWVLNFGSEDMIGKSRKIMMYAAMGLIIVMLSYSVVRFITGAVPSGTVPGPVIIHDCLTDNDCIKKDKNFPVCLFSTKENKNKCEARNLPDPNAGGECKSSLDCKRLYCQQDVADCKSVCLYNITVKLNECVQPPKPSNACTVDEDCALGFRCETTHNYCVLDDKNLPLTFAACKTNNQCPAGFTCDTTIGRCKAKEGAAGSAAVPAANTNLDKADNLLKDLKNAFDTTGLEKTVKEKTEKTLKSAAPLDTKISEVKKLMSDASVNPSDKNILKRVVGGLESLKLLKEELLQMKKNMPESKDILAAYDETLQALDEYIADPTDAVRSSRFESKYKKLRDLIAAFPVVQAAIRATPSGGNAPFTVQLSGLDSIDPMGGTISDYRWSYIDATGSEVSLGTGPVILHEFTEANTYAVRLQVSTPVKDADGYKKAADGLSIIRITVNPPSSSISFKINGQEAGLYHNVTLQEALAGLSFDPSPSKPALGRNITDYQWSFGDDFFETRSVPVTVLHKYQKAGDYTVRLIARDNLGIEDAGTVKLSIKDLAAAIVISPAKGGNVNTQFTFDGKSSRSDFGAIQSYQWEIKDKSGAVVFTGAESSFTHKFKSPGTYNISLIISDSTGAKDQYVDILEIESRPPVASFETKIVRRNHPNRVDFNAVDSYDPDEGDRLVYSWDFDGDGVFDEADQKATSAVYTYNRVGEYKVKLQVQDAYGKKSHAEKTVTIESVLSGDIEVARRALQVDQETEFKALSPNAKAYLWVFGDGETENTVEPILKHAYEKAGRYEVRLNFFDEEENENYATLPLLVGSKDLPMAMISVTQNGQEPFLIDDLCGKGKEGIAVRRIDHLQFSANQSINEDGTGRLLDYDWRFPGGESSASKEVNYKFDEINREGECFQIGLVVRSQLTGKVSKEDILPVKVINELPFVTDFVINPPETENLVTPAKVMLRVMSPKDLDGTIKKFRWWYYREGKESEEKLGTHTTGVPYTDMIITSYGEPDAINRYYFAVEVTDNDNGVYNSIERFGEVSYLDIKNGPNLSPVADFVTDKTTISAGDSITFISHSYDPQGDPLPLDAFRWDFDGDGEFDDVGSGPQVSRQYNTPGEFNPRLKVIYRGLSSSAVKPIFVEPTDTYPQAGFTYEIDGNTVIFDASPSRYDPSLADIALRFEWDFDTRNDANGNGINDDDVESDKINPSFTYDQKGIYKVKLKVKDMLGMEGVTVREVNLLLTQADREKQAYHSLRVSAPKHPITTLDVDITPAELSRTDSADIKIRVLNADGSPYDGKVFLEVLEGSGQFTPNPVIAENSKASAVFYPVDPGKVKVRVRATETLHGELSEEAIINVK